MKQIASIFFILTIVYTTIGVKINAHYCELSNVTNYSVFEVEDCCPPSKSSCSFHQKKDDCCTDEINLVHLGQDIHFYPDAITPSPHLEVYSFIGFIVKQALNSQEQTKAIRGRVPPLLKIQEDFQSLHQVYII